jgi:hypothetical protein
VGRLVSWGLSLLERLHQRRLAVWAFGLGGLGLGGFGLQLALAHHPGWRKSTLSNANGCVEVAFVHNDTRIAVRDSKNRHGPVLMFTPAEWAAFLGGVRGGEFDLSAMHSGDS